MKKIKNGSRVLVFQNRTLRTLTSIDLEQSGGGSAPIQSGRVPSNGLPCTTHNEPSGPGSGA